MSLTRSSIFKCSDALSATPLLHNCNPASLIDYVASLTPDLSRTRFLTYVTAKYGAVPAYVAADAQGNVLIAGATAAPGYPTTPDSYQPNYTAVSKTVLTCGHTHGSHFTQWLRDARKGGRVGTDFFHVFQRQQDRQRQFRRLDQRGDISWRPGGFRGFAGVRWRSAFSVPPRRLRDSNGAGWIGHFVNPYAARNSAGIRFRNRNAAAGLRQRPASLRPFPWLPRSHACWTQPTQSGNVGRVRRASCNVRAFPILRDNPSASIDKSP